MRLFQQLILTACIIVSICLKSVQPHNKRPDRAVASEVNDDEKKIQGNLQDLFDTIAQQDTKKSEAYRTILEREVLRERQDFDAVKEELQFTRRGKNARRSGTAEKDIVAIKRQVKDGENYILDFDLSSLEYKGNWSDFCNTTKMEEDFAEFTDHDVKRLRFEICQFKARNNQKIDRRSLPNFSTYKYCHSIRASTDRAHKLLRKKFDEHFANRVGEIPDAGPPTDECFSASMEVFYKKCMGRLNPCLRMFQSLISSVCVKPGISSKHITRYMAEVCAGDYISDEIDWMPIDWSLKYSVIE